MVERKHKTLGEILVETQHKSPYMNLKYQELKG